MKKGILIFASLLSIFSFSESNIVVRPYGTTGLSYYGEGGALDLNIGLDTKKSVYKDDKLEVLVGGGLLFKHFIGYSPYAKSTYQYINNSIYPLVEARHIINKDLKFYTNLKPALGFNERFTDFNIGIEAGLEYKKFDFGVITAYHAIYALSMGVDLGFRFGYNFDIPIE